MRFLPPKTHTTHTRKPRLRRGFLAVPAEKGQKYPLTEPDLNGTVIPVKRLRQGRVAGCRIKERGRAVEVPVKARRRRLGAAGRKCPAGRPRYGHGERASPEFRWDHGQRLFALSQKWLRALFVLSRYAIVKEGETIMNHSDKTMDKIVNLCKGRGFIFAGSEIYGGLANSWDYGPLGVEFKNNVKRAWWKKFVQENPYNVGLDAAILMNAQTWVTTGHVSNFNDPLLDCKACKARHRADKLIGDECADVNVDAMSFEEMDQYIASHENIVCPVCGKHDFTPIRKFNMMFKTQMGVTEDSSSTVYLRPETAQGIFVNFANIQRLSLIHI